eukprot:9472767-Pyramimonas_sp.AAC.1
MSLASPLVKGAGCPGSPTFQLLLAVGVKDLLGPSQDGVDGIIKVWVCQQLEARLKPRGHPGIDGQQHCRLVDALQPTLELENQLRQLGDRQRRLHDQAEVGDKHRGLMANGLARAAHMPGPAGRRRPAMLHC